jgi:hypothetical protein
MTINRKYVALAGLAAEALSPHLFHQNAAKISAGQGRSGIFLCYLSS